VDAGTNQTRLDADDAVWNASPGETLTARRAVVYKDTGVAATSPLLAWVDFETDVSATGGPLTVQFDSTGIVRLTAAS
jgi:hypothetical protein